MPAGDLADATSAAEILSSMSAPEALAVSTFETGATGPDAAGKPGWIVEAYFDDEPDLKTVRQALDTAIASPASIDAITIRRVPDENWVALSQAALPPVQAGRFTIHGSHDRESAGNGPMTIEIDAGEAFGTAHHATTMGCLLALDRLTMDREFTAVLDLGCGSAVLAIAAARVLPQAKIIASDIDPQATKVARQNIALNGEETRINVVTASGLDDTALNKTGYFDLVFANILAAPLIELAANIGKVVRPDGIAILSGLLNEQADDVLAAYKEAGFTVLEHQQIDDWSTLTLTSP